MRADDILFGPVDREKTPRIFERETRMAESVKAMGLVRHMPVIKEQIVEHRSARKASQVRIEMKNTAGPVLLST